MRGEPQALPGPGRILLVDFSTMATGWPPLALLAADAIKVLATLVRTSDLMATLEALPSAPVITLVTIFLLAAAARIAFIRRIFSRGLEVPGKLAPSVRDHDIELEYTFHYGGQTRRATALLPLRVLWKGSTRVTVVVDSTKPSRSFIREIYCPDL